MRHQQLPCHRVEKWNRNCFVETTLLDEGFILHLGHGSMVCPGRTEWDDLGGQGALGEDELDNWDEQDLEGENHDPSTYPKSITLVAVNGFFRHKVAWCHCSNLHRNDPRRPLLSMFWTTFGST